jgi:hypothetical protein
MAVDTGPPWNIPYIEPTDLVRSYPAADEAQALAIAAGLSAAGNPGIGTNVVQAVKTDTFETTTTSFEAITGLSISITPSSDTSKVLLILNVKGASEQDVSNSTALFRVMRGSTAIGIGDSAGNRTRSTGSLSTRTTGASGILLADTAVLLDSPNTDSSVTYSVEILTVAGRAFVNRSQTDSDVAAIGRTVSSITAVEVAT